MERVGGRAGGHGGAPICVGGWRECQERGRQCGLWEASLGPVKERVMPRHSGDLPQGPRPLLFLPLVLLSRAFGTGET